MIKLIATDLDGTLLHPKRALRLVSRPNRSLLREFSAHGGKIALVSGRKLEFCQKIEKRLGISCDIIASAGAVTVSADGKFCSEVLIPMKIAQEVDRFFEQKKAPAVRLYTLNHQPVIASGWVLRWWEKALLPLVLLRTGRYQEKTLYHRKQFYRLLDEPNEVVKMSLIFYKKNLDYIRPLYRELKDRYGKHLEFVLFRNALEITFKGINKGKAMLALAEWHGLGVDEVAVVGDDANDIPMFQVFPNSFAMGHGIEAAKSSANIELERFTDLKNYL